jgi:hypothetical protein
MFGGIAKGITGAVSGAVNDVLGNLDLDTETLLRVGLAAATGNPMLIGQAAVDVLDGEEDQGLAMFNQAMGMSDLLGGDPMAMLGGDGLGGLGGLGSGSGYGPGSNYDGGYAYQGDLSHCCRHHDDPHVRDGFSSLYQYSELSNSQGYWSRA